MSQTTRAEAITTTSPVATAIGRMLLASLLVGTICLLVLPMRASASTLVTPADGTHFDYLELAPMLTFDPATGESPKWILLASDAQMEQTVRYCRQFQWAFAAGGWHWGCDRWAVGVDQNGADKLLALVSGRTYYWQVVSSKTTGETTTEVKSAVRAFAIDTKPVEQDPGEIAEEVHQTVVGDGTYLNTGAASFVQSGVKLVKVGSQRIAPQVFRFNANFIGRVDARRSYVKVSSRAGTRYLPVSALRAHTVRATWSLNASERRLRTKRFTWQVFFKSSKNGAMVRSAPRVLLIRSNGTVATTTTVRPLVEPIQ